MIINYYTIRSIFVFILLLPLLIRIIKNVKVNNTNKEKQKEDKKVNIKLVIICIVIYLILYKIISYPLENLFVNFKSSEDIFKYYNPSEKINKRIEEKNYVYFISRKKGSNIMNCYYYIKTSGWHIDTNNKNGKIIKYDNAFSFDPTAPSFIITRLNKDKKYYIYLRFKSSDDGKDIFDSEKSEIIDINRSGVDWYGKLIILDSSKINVNEYYIVLNNKRYFILK